MVLQLRNMVRQKIKKTRAKAFSIRFSKKEKSLLNSIAKEKQFDSYTKVIHYILGQAGVLEEKYQNIVREQEDLKKRFKL